jgi:hypothetical protein
VVSYEGLRALGVPAGGAEKGRGAVAAPQKEFGTAVLFCLDTSFTARTAGGVLRLLQVKPARDSSAHLLALIEARAAELPLPDGCLVIRGGERLRLRLIWPDPLSALAVLSKCSDHVWLRAKNPSLAAALARRSVMLFVPPGLQHRLPQENA